MANQPQQPDTALHNASHLMQYHDLIESIVAALDARDAYTASHSDRVADMVLVLAAALGLDEDETTRIHMAAHLHDIGKSLVATQLAVNGYEVVDLGTDVPTNKFIDTAVAENADIIAVSSLLTTSQYYMEELIHRLTNEGKRDKFHIAIGGGPINPDYAEKIGADGYSRTADLAVKMADRLMAAAPQSGLISEV